MFDYEKIKCYYYHTPKKGAKKSRRKSMKNNLRVLLAKKRLKVSDLAKGTKLSKSALTALYYERTKRPDITTLQKVANFLNVTIDELLNVEE